MPWQYAANGKIKSAERAVKIDSLIRILFLRANFKTSPFAQYLRQAQILILEILNVFLWLKFSPSLILNKIEHFETASLVLSYFSGYHAPAESGLSSSGTCANVLWGACSFTQLHYSVRGAFV